MVAAFARTHLGINPLRRRGRKMKQFGKARKEGKDKDKVKGMGKCSSGAKIFKIRRFKAPFRFVCEKCEEVVLKGEEFDAIKESVGTYCGSEIWSYTINCLSCGNKVVMDKHPKDQRYKVVEGVKSCDEGEQDFERFLIGDDFDWKAWKEKRSKEILEGIAPGLSQKYNIFDVFGTCFVEGDLSSDESLRVLC